APCLQLFGAQRRRCGRLGLFLRSLGLSPHALGLGLLRLASLALLLPLDPLGHDLRVQRRLGLQLRQRLLPRLGGIGDAVLEAVVVGHGWRLLAGATRRRWPVAQLAYWS